MTQVALEELGIETDWDTDAIVGRRNRFYSASQRAFVPYKTPLIIKRGAGQYLWDEKGNKYLDMLGMNLCVSVGHSHPAVVEAIRRQAEDIQHCTTMFYHPVPAHFAEELAATMPAGEDWVVHFTNSGAEAIDLALLMARSHTGNKDIVSLQGSYHGATFGAQSVTGIHGFRHNVPLLSDIHFAPCPNQYRGRHGAGLEPYLQDLDDTIAYATSGSLAGMFIEPIQGYGGIVPMPQGYLQGAFERVRAAGGLAIIDEVQSGFARVGDAMWGFQLHDVVPDIVVLAKGIGNGIPLGAVVAKRDVAESMADKFLFHTYGANPMACAAGRAVLRVIEEEGLQENARVVGAAFLEVLRDLKQRYEFIGDVRGQGLMLAMEFVTDRESKNPDADLVARLFEMTREERLVMSKSGTFRNVLRMVPPLCISMEDVEFFDGAIRRCLDRV